MATVKTQGDLTVVGGNVRIEQGPKRLKGVATPDLLHDNVTASHYQVGLRDAAGNIIEAGKEFEYLDHGGAETEGQRVFYVYKRRELTPADQEKEQTTYTYRYDEIGVKATYEDALELAQKHAKD